LNVVCLQVPPLRERQQDIPLLCEHLTQQLSDETGRPPRPISSEAMAILQSYSWPGNVRELRNEILRLLTFDQGEVSPQDLSNFVDKPAIDDTTGLSRKQTLPQKLEAVEIDAIRQMIAQEGGNRTAAAKALGISRFSLLRKIEKYGIDLPDENNG
ncbi:MAG: helix-turn-helix domain-containing protein, partial [Planctomycetota bacterium]|nr:helix-turn-helix domain-containing protein [Planctomycetota bacterium]